MDGSMLGGLAAVGGVIVVALIMRAARPGDAGASGAPGTSPPLEPWRDPSRDSRPGGVSEHLDEADVDDMDEARDTRDGSHLVVAVTSDGAALVPDRYVVRLVPPEEQGEGWKVGAGMRSANLRGEQALAMTWQAGEFTGARVVRGAAEEGPWRLELLGREGEYITFFFETPEAAEAAKQLFEQQDIVQLGEDEDGRPMPPSPEQFVEARRIYLETEAALELPDDEEPR
jgi:hypothetical protein